MDFDISTCANIAVPIEIMTAVVMVESNGNPFAIGVVGDSLVRQPRNLVEAVATVNQLKKNKLNYSVGMAQVNQVNFKSQGFETLEQGFKPCNNIVAGSNILKDCFTRSSGHWGKAFSCYYSGNFTKGYSDGYVARVMSQLSTGLTYRLPAQKDDSQKTFFSKESTPTGYKLSREPHLTNDTAQTPLKDPSFIF